MNQPRVGRCNPSRRRWVREDVDLAIVEAADPDYANVLAAAHGTGADRSDLPKLRRRQVNLEQATIDIFGGKTKGRTRTGVPKQAWALPFIAAACDGKAIEDLLFAGLSADAITRAHKRAAERAQADDYWLRDGRRSYAVRAILRAAPIRDASRCLGHTNLATTYKVYVHFDGEVRLRLEEWSGDAGATSTDVGS